MNLLKNQNEQIRGGKSGNVGKTVWRYARNILLAGGLLATGGYLEKSSHDKERSFGGFGTYVIDKIIPITEGATKSLKETRKEIKKDR